MIKIKEYKIISGRLQDISDEVQKSINEGWQPYGNMVYTECIPGGYGIQMVMYEGNDKKYAQDYENIFINSPLISAMENAVRVSNVECD